MPRPRGKTEDGQPQEISNNHCTPIVINACSQNPGDDQGEDDASQDVGGVRAHEAVLGDANGSSERRNRRRPFSAPSMARIWLRR